jgi:hypothetical protein
MTRKDYILLADALRAARRYVFDHGNTGEEAVAVASHFVIEALARDNPRFDRERFLEAL